VTPAPTEPARIEQPPTGRAGRNLPAAIGVGVLLAGVVVVSLFARKEAFVGVVAVAAVLGVRELTTAFGTRGIKVPFIPLSGGAVGMVLAAYVSAEEGLVLAFALTAFALVLWRIVDGVSGAVQDVVASVFSAAYVPLLAGFACLMLAQRDGPQRILVTIGVVAASDVGGYTAGVLFGKHPMAPTISPKKSWEGFAGSTTACLAVGAGLVVWLLSGPWWAGLAVGAACVVSATLGDLSESLIKRDLGIKDMGDLLPGHGGLMDRLDSLLPSAPVAYLLLALFVPVVR